ncbi:MAG: hypothetical protein GTO18_16305 [Anaerolineales bacterium]|nr:hypothetical protein [Anaerolineales bacterium]
MRDWTLDSTFTLPLRIAADARSVQPDYVDDQIWELSIEGGDPPAVAIQTTYGLRAKSFRLFPGFSLGGAVLSDPASFHQPPVVQKFFPNYVRVAYEPFIQLVVLSEYWVLDSHQLGGRIRIHNLSDELANVRLRIYAYLIPNEGGERMGEWSHQGVKTLTGRTENLAPVVFITGGATVDHAIYPALTVNTPIPSGESQDVLWSHAGLEDRVSSFEAARELVGRRWDAEIARLELLNESMIDVETGNSDWDVALSLSQKVALGSYLGPTRALPNPSFVLNRVPDRGYSRSGDGKDYGWQWDGQNALTTYVHLPQLLLNSPDLAKGVIRNFLAIRRPDGTIDWKPGMGGQRSGTLSTPLLATMSWKIFEQVGDKEFLKEVFSGLCEFLDSWFEEEHDRDGDGFPEWDHTTQMGFDDCPTFVRWRKWGQGLDITLAETPDLAAYLYRESTSLLHIANQVGLDDPPGLKERADLLKHRLEATWSEKTLSYHHMDRDSHGSVSGEVLNSDRGEFSFPVEREFEEPVRLLFQVKGQEGLTHKVQVFVHGKGKRGRPRIERIRERHFQWFYGLGTATTEKTYARIDRVEVKGLSDAFKTTVLIGDFKRHDVSLLLPLWAGIPDKGRAEVLIEKTLLDPKRYWRTNGIPSCSAKDPAYRRAIKEGAVGVQMIWNLMLGEALLAYGYRQEAAELVTRLMNTVVRSLRDERAFRDIYHPDEPKAIGEGDHLSGIAPLGLFLETLGVRLISPRKFFLRGTDPFPDPVIIRWKGTEIHCLQDRKQVQFLDGAMIEVVGEDLQFVEQVE